MPREALAIHLSIPLDERVTLPKSFCQRLEWLTGNEVEAWLYLIEPGRYRLLSDKEAETDPQLDPIRARILHENQFIRGQPSQATPARIAVDAARLTPITIDLHKGSWRLSFRAELASLAPADCNPRTLSMLMPDGFLEIWYTDVLRKFLDSPWRAHQR
jgi:hypothetical protein